MEKGTANKDTDVCSLDRRISKVLQEIIERPLFINLQHTSTDISQVLSPHYPFTGDVELVGSTTDGLKTARCFDVGDTDMLVYANVTFSAADEATFEYRKDNSSWFHVPLPTRLSHIQPVDEKYLSARSVRARDKAIFGNEDEHFYRVAPYTILFSTVDKSDLKCAETSAVQWSDRVFQEHDKASEHSIAHSLYFIWMIEHVFFTFLLNNSVGEKLKIVREILYGDKLDQNEKSLLVSKLKFIIALLKEDAQRVTVNMIDTIYFRHEPFVSILQQAADSNLQEVSKVKPHGEYSSDIVPAIRCKAWPRPATSFITRPRVWPSKDVIEEIVKEGFRVVPKAAILNPNQEKDFILSFSHAEVELVRLLPQEARTAYCLLKMCYKSYELLLTQGNKMKTYHLKQALLWVAEGRVPDSWGEAGPLQCIRWICEFLMDVLKRGYFPSFFVEGSNHIYHFTDEDRQRHFKLFAEIHRNPVNYLKIVIDQEWDYNKRTMPDDSFKQIQEPGYFSSFTSKELLKIYMFAYASTDGYQIEKLFDMKDFSEQAKICQPLVEESLRSNPPGSIELTLGITENQLMYVDIFVQTVTQLNIDLFNVLEQEIDDDIRTHETHWLPEEIIEKYPQIQYDSPKDFGEQILTMLRLRLKYYGNLFHEVCNRLYFAAFNLFNITIINHDAKFIVRFLKDLVTKRNFNMENVQDLLHYLFYFCHFTRLRHHKLNTTDQIIRSMREFLQDARVLMTVYFNPKLLMPRPVDNGETIKNMLYGVPKGSKVEMELELD